MRAMKKQATALFLLASYLACSTAYSAPTITDAQAKALSNKAFDGNTSALGKLQGYAKAGDSNAEVWLAGYYLTKHNYSLAISLYHQAAKLSNRMAEFNLGSAYAYGRGVNLSQKKALYWWSKAADSGYSHASFVIAEAYFDGSNGLTRNQRIAMQWYKKAAQQGSAKAAFNVAVAYHYGIGLPRSYSKSCQWFRQSAEMKYAWAAFNLATVCYATGNSRPSNHIKEVTWLLVAENEASPNSKTSIWARGNIATGFALYGNKVFKKAREQAKDIIDRLRPEAGINTSGANHKLDNKQLIGQFASEMQKQVYWAWKGNFSAALSCVVHIQLTPQGQIIGRPKILRTSGNSQFDQTVISAIDHASPFSPPVGIPYHIYKNIDIHFNSKEFTQP